MHHVDDAVRALAAGQHGLATTAQVLRLGLDHSDVRSRCRRGQWRVLIRGVYLIDADMYADATPARTWWRAGLLAYGDGHCLVATTAAAAFGLPGLPGWRDVVEIARVNGSSRAARAINVRAVDPACRVVLRQLPVREDEIVMIDGLRVRDAFHTVIDTALAVDRATGLAVLDAALHNNIVSAGELARSADEASHRPGIVAVRELLALADARAESQVESRVRLACVDGDVPPDDLQYVVRDASGHPVARGDLAWLKVGRRPLLAEADGQSVHSLPTPVYRDRTRGNALVAEACDTVRFTFADTLRRGYIPHIVKQALRAA